MLDVAEQVLALRTAVESEERHEIDADDAALVCDGLDRFIAGVARVVGQRPCAGVADHQRPLGESRRLGHRARAAVAEIEQQSLRLHPLDRRLAELRQARVRREIAVVVGELDGHHPVLLHLRQPIELRPHHRRVLGAEQHAEPLLALRLEDISGTPDEQHVIGIRVDDVVLGLNALLVLAPGIADVTHREYGVAHDRNARSCRLGPAAIAVTELVVRRVGVADAAQRVDNDRAVIPTDTPRAPLCERGRGDQARNSAHKQGPPINPHNSPVPLHARCLS